MKTQIGLAAAVFAFALAACAGSGVQSNPGSTGSTGGTSGTSGTSGDFTPCSASNACPSGEFCFNGICALGCNSDGDCAANQYCDTGETRLCQNKTVPTCAGNGDCASGQICESGLCSTPAPSTSCQVSYDQNDGCEKSSVCLADPSDDQAPPKCHSFPACAQDATCPIGVQGALCNVDYLPGKAKICLPGLCTSAANCPAQWKCIKASTSDVIGECSNGATGQSCTVGTDCQSGNCQSFGPGFGGVCF